MTYEDNVEYHNVPVTPTINIPMEIQSVRAEQAYGLTRDGRERVNCGGQGEGVGHKKKKMVVTAREVVVTVHSGQFQGGRGGSAKYLYCVTFCT